MGVKFTDELYKYGADTNEYGSELENDEWELNDEWESDIEVDSQTIVENNESSNLKRKSCFRGEIEVTSFIVNRDLEPLGGVRVLLFRVERGTPKLVDSKVTNAKGEVRFSDLPEGVYILSQPIDKCHFLTPLFVPGDRVVLNRSNREAEVAIINRLRRRCHNRCRNDFDDFGCIWILFLLLFCGGCGFGFFPFLF